MRLKNKIIISLQWLWISWRLIDSFVADDVSVVVVVVDVVIVGVDVGVGGGGVSKQHRPARTKKVRNISGFFILRRRHDDLHDVLKLVHVQNLK